MKKILALGCFCATLLMTSCLGEGGGFERSGTMPGVVEYNTKIGKNVVFFSNYEFVYADRVAKDPSIADGSCIMLSYTLKEDSPENVGALERGYYTVLASAIAPLDNYHIAPYLTDTATLMPKEIAISNLDNSLPNNYWGLVRNNLFINTYHKSVLTGIKMSFNLSFDSDADPVEVSGQRVYNLYLRANVLDEGKSPQQDMVSISTYNIKDFLQYAIQRERSEGNENVYFRLNYINEIDEKTNMPTWFKTDAYTYAIPKED